MKRTVFVRGFEIRTPLYLNLLGESAIIGDLENNPSKLNWYFTLMNTTDYYFVKAVFKWSYHRWNSLICRYSVAISSFFFFEISNPPPAPSNWKADSALFAIVRYLIPLSAPPWQCNGKLVSWPMSSIDRWCKALNKQTRWANRDVFSIADFLFPTDQFVLL